MTFAKPIPLLASCVALCLGLSACATPPTAIKQIGIVAEAGANQNNATAIDIVFVYDRAAVGMLPKSSPDWFAKKAALLNVRATEIDVVALQIPPSMEANVALPARYKNAIGVFSYANYIDEKVPAVGNLTPYHGVTIILKPGAVVFAPAN